MAFSRNSLVAAVAGTLSLAMLTGCPGPNPAGPTTPGASAGASAAPTAAPTAGTSAAPTTAPTAGASGGPTVAPSVTPSSSPLAPTTVQGKVYDSTGALVTSGAKVNIKSLNPSNPFETNIDVVNGNYVANNVPAGVLVQITASKDGYTARTKVDTLLPLQTASNGNTVNFGGPSGTTSGNEDPYFIAKFPEVSSTEPVSNTTLADASKLVYKLTLSEPLNSDNQRRFARALRVFPVNAQATLNNGFTAGFGGGSNTGAVNATDISGAAAQYTIQEGSTFLTTDVIASVTWDAAGQVATLTFNAPLKTDKDNKATYGVGLIQNNEKITDAAGDQLGLVGGNFNQTVNNATTTLLEDVFKKPELPTLTGITGTTAEQLRWQETHDNVATFDVAQDSTSPTFASLSVTGGNILTLTFSEPMVAYGGSSTGQNFISNGVTDPNNYVIRVAEKVEDLADQKLDTTSATLDRWASAAAGTNYTLTAGNGTSTGFKIEVSTSDPKVVRILPNDLTQSWAKFPVAVKAVKVRVTTNVKDPAGNAVSTSSDSNLKTSAI